ncbi:MAG: ribose 5-phosphate isomerase B [Candidatus Omnitrophica bacterium]|jgi:ribose 5-phosphate isomerase B|nr:ribose 5-phosphate isomerase B [Candidatus Omnitrophota bacterium]
MKELLIASDHAGFILKKKLSAFLKSKGILVRDLGTYNKERCDYPQYAYKLAKLISDGKNKLGILACKSGIGDSIVANRLPGVRAALCYNLKAAKLSRQHNDSNVLVLGAAFVKMELVKKIVLLWLKTDFAGGRHRRRLNQIKAIEKKIRRECK